MTKRLHSKYSACKRLRGTYKNLWGLSKKNYLRSVLNNKKRKRSTLFGKLLNIKQSFKLFYSNVGEVNFKKYVQQSVNSPSKSTDKLSSVLESRLDCILFRSCLARSFLQARQLINHGCVKVNGLLVKNPSAKLSNGDIIKLDSTAHSINLFNEVVSSRSLPNYLEVDFSTLTIIFLWDTDIKNCFYPIKLKYLNVFRYYK